MLQDRLVLLGVAGLAAVATAGWMRTPAVNPAGSMVNGFQPPQETMLEQPALPVAFASMPAATHPVATSRFSAPAQAVRRTVTPVQYRDEARPVAQARRANIAYDDRPVTVERTRSTKASAAIIGGGAAAGAAIGGLAGGGKGAIIGAVSGAGAGLVYDRMTAKKRAPTDEYGYRNSTANDDYRTEGRSTAKSAAIIGGGAAAGAAIGAAAGGGKGAAIGALGGGAAGYIYDRMTKNR
jgi:hypothetical protein